MQKTIGIPIETTASGQLRERLKMEIFLVKCNLTNLRALWEFHLLLVNMKLRL